MIKAAVPRRPWGRYDVGGAGLDGAPVMRMSTVQIVVIDGFFERLLERVCLGYLR